MQRTVEKWKEKYRESRELAGKNVDVMTGFNANIDVIHRDYDIPDVEPNHPEDVESRKELYSVLQYCIENLENHEVDYSGFSVEEEGVERIGGQAAIMSNFLSGDGNAVIFYTPYLSGELAEKMDEKILYPVEDEGEFYLKNVQDAVNSDRTKRNHIFEFENGRTGRLILSDSLKGFGPYFESSVEEYMPLIESNIDCCIFSGFHNADGNIDAKIQKASQQIADIEKPIHIEYVHSPDIGEKVLEKIVPETDSLGVDETELDEITSMLGIEGEKPFNFGEAFSALKELIEELEISRIHLHTYRYHITVTRESYRTGLERIRDSMLFGEVSAIRLADKGKIPDEKEVAETDPGNYVVNGIETLEDFGEYHGKPGFSEEGTAEIDGFKVVGIPSLVHEDPARTVGMGDVISSGAFSSEFKSSD